MKKRLYKSNGVKCASPASLLDNDTIKAIENFLKKKNIRLWCCFCLANNTALRASDLLSLKVSDLFENGKVKNLLVLYEQKTNKLRQIALNNKAKEVLTIYYKTKKQEIQRKGNNYLFPSRKSRINSEGEKYYTGINVSSYDGVLREAKIALNIPEYETVSSHCSRKALASNLYNKGVPIELIQNMLLHDSPKTTLVYSGIYRKQSQSLYLDVEI